MVCRNERDRLSPCERRALPVRKFGRLLPGVKQMNLSFSDSDFESVSTMVNNAKGASIDLRDAQLDQLPKFSLQSRFFQMSFDVVKALQRRPGQMVHLRLCQSGETGGCRGSGGHWN